MRLNLGVNIGKLKLKNPVMAASGTFGEEYRKLTDISSLGALVTKTITLKPRVGNPPPRIVETASGMLNAIGLENKGLDDFVNNKMPVLRKFGTALVVSMAGDDENEFAKLAGYLSKTKGIDALELNLSCPNLIRRVKGQGSRVKGKEKEIIAQDEEAVYRIVKAVKKATNLVMIAKLSPNVTDISEIARVAESAGADAVSLVNTFSAMAVDIDTKKPMLGNITGGLSGPAIKPIALKMVWEAYEKIKIPIVGIGGIMSYKDAVEFMLCGATAIQVGTANFVNPRASTEVIDGIKDYMRENRISDINNLIGDIRS